MDWMRLESEKLLTRAVPLPETEPISGSSDITDPPAFFPPGNTDGVTAWLLSQGKHASDYDYKTIDWYPSFHTREDAGSALPPIYVSLPREATCRDFGVTSCPLSLSSIPISLPREAAQFGFTLSNSTKTHLSPKSQTSPGSVRDSKSLFSLKLDQSLKTECGSDLESSQSSRKSSRASPKSCRSRKSQLSHVSYSVSSEDAVVPLTTGESTIWDASAAVLQSIPVSLPKEALTTRHGSMATHHGDMTTCRGDMTMRHGDMAAHHSDVATHHSDMATCHGDMTVRRGDMATHHSDMATHHGDMRTYHGDSCAVTCTRRCCSSVDDRSCTSCSGSTLSYGHSFPVEGQSHSVEGRPCLGEGQLDEVNGSRRDAFDEDEVPEALLQLLGESVCLSVHLCVCLPLCLSV